MKRYGIVLCILFLCVHAVHAQTLSADITFEERVHDFGTIAEQNGRVSHTFVFTNNGKTPVTVNEIYSGCGCIGRTLSKAPVKPGGKGQVTITFNPDYKSGFFSKEIVVYSNNGRQYNRIWVQGHVQPGEHPVEDEYPYNFGNGLYLRLKVMAFGYVKPGETKQMELHFANETNSEMALSFFIDGKKDGLKFTSPGKVAPRARGMVSFMYTMPYFGDKDAVFTVYPYINGKKLKEPVEVKILNGNKLSISK